MKYLLTVLLICVSFSASAGTIVTQDHLRDDQIEWLKKWKSEETSGTHQFFYYVVVGERYFSLPLSELRKVRERKLSEYFNNYIKETVEAEKASLIADVQQGIKLFRLIFIKEQDVEYAKSFVEIMFPSLSFDITDGKPYISKTDGFSTISIPAL